jgi:hypothetical protein
MLRKINGTNSFHIKFLGRINIKCQNGPMLPSAQVFYFNGQALTKTCFIPKEVAETSQVFLRETFYQNNLAMRLLQT